MADSGTRRTGHGPIIALASGAGFLALLDATVVNLAVPGIRQDFAPASLSAVTWTITAYAVVFAALLASAGRLADVISVRRLFVGGVGLFTAFSLLCALAPNLGWLIAGRAAQAVGAAAMVPASLAILLLGVPAARRATAIGLWSAAGSLAAAVGPSLGGLLVDAVGWRALFVINLPVGIALCAFARLAPATRSTGTLPDLVGTTLFAGGVASVVLGLTQSADWGWGHAGTISLLLGGGLSLVWALSRSYRRPAPAIEVSLWRTRAFTLTNVVSLLYGAALYSWLLAGVLVLTSVWRYTELRAGLAMSAGAVSAAVTAAVLGRITGRLGPRPAVVGGALAMAASGLWLAIGLTTQPDFLTLWLPIGLLVGAGMGAVAAGTNNASALYAPPAQFASAAGLNTTARQLGGALGVAALAIVQQRRAGHGLDPFIDVYLFDIAATLLAAAVGLLLVRPPAAALRPAGPVTAAPAPQAEAAAR